VLILPYFEEQELYDQYRFDEPWNGPNNQKLGSRIMEIFQCPGDADYGRTPTTNYVAVVGEGTAFPGDRTTRLADFRDGLENTILLMEVANTGIHWMEPRDLRLDSISADQNAEPVIADANHPAGAAVLFADKIEAFRLQAALRSETLRALLTIAGGEPVTRDSLVRPERPGIISEATSK
jgi:hypothetical protein